MAGGELILLEKAAADVATPSTGKNAFFFDSGTGKLSWRDDAAVVHTISEATGTAGTLDFDTDGTLAANSDAKVATQKATKTYADTKIPKSLVDVKGDLIAATAADTVARLAAGANGKVLTAASGETTGLIWNALPVELMLACSDETTAIAATGVKLTFRMPFAMTLTSARANLTTASASGGPFTVDIKEGGVTIFSTLLTIDDTELTSTTATASVISDAALADDAQITIEVTDVGDGAAVGLKVTLIGTRA